ncbi:hypothetical protein QTH28_13625 [Clostridium perfringens]|nr:hypothetical protein [Clostridium perfringens]
MLNCIGNEIIYVVCSAKYKTGGTELLHQLVYSLKQNGLNAYITYTNVKESENPINDAFKEYVSEYKTLENIIDNEENIIIIPEINISLIDKFSKAKTVIWWLSVDNYLKVYSLKYSFKLVGFKGVLWYLKNRNWRYRIKNISNKINYNLAQSYYAIDFLNKNNFKNIEYLSDYIGNKYLNKKENLNEKRENLVLYNPKKGLEFTKKLMEVSKDLKWVPIINMTNDEVFELLNKSKVYVDFGNHPGKDRFPREAAYCGCCIITGKDGSANYFKDVSIGDQYKYDSSNQNIDLIIKKIRECLDNFENNQKNFDEYRNIIKNEKCRFNKDVKDIFLL